MKRFRLLILFIFILIPLVLTACGDTDKLKTPFGADVEMTSLTFTWHEVKGARLYTIEITPEGKNPVEVDYSKNRYPLTSLEPGKYQLRVKANGKNGESKDSDWSEPIPFEREEECGLEFSLNSDGKSYTVKSKGDATGDIVIPDTYRTYPVTAVGYKAFFNKGDVTGISFGKYITEIGDFAFGNCSYITELTLPDGLTSIGESAFANCRLIDGDVFIPGSVEVISKGAFANCIDVDSFYFEEGIKRIETSAFSSCNDLTYVYLPDSVEYLGTSAFSMCNGVTSVDLGNGVKTIDNYSLSALPSLTEITIPDSVTSIGDGAFYKCIALTTVNLGNGVGHIGKGAFEDTALFNPTEDEENEVYVGSWLIGLRDYDVQSFTVREGTTAIAAYTFYGNKSIVKVSLPASVTRIDTAAFAMSSITSAVIGEGVKYIGDEAFLGCGYLSTVILGSYDADEAKIKRSSLEVIGNSVFKNCIGLSKIEMPSSLETVGSNTFLYSGLHYSASTGVVYAGNWVVGYNGVITDTVDIREDTVGISNYAFYSCAALRYITIPSTVRTIGKGAFYNCESLLSVELPSTLEIIEDYTFYRCLSMKIPSLPLYLRSIGRSAFYKCGSNVEAKFTDTANDVLILPDTLTYIGAYAFYGCGYREDASISDEANYNYYGIDEIIFGDNLKTVGDHAFSGFSSLQKVSLGNTQYLGNNAFYMCESLTYADLGYSMIEIGQKAFYRCERLADVSVPNTLVKVGARAFYKCISLRSASLLGVEYIGDYAFFGNTALTEVQLSPALYHIGKQAFRNCCELSAVTLGDDVEYIGGHAFYGNHSLTVYVSKGAITENWSTTWNSSHRPVIFGCEMAEDDGHIISFTKSNVQNLNQSNLISAPVWVGYSFIGWDEDENATIPTYASPDFSQAADGVTLYAIWVKD